MSKDLSQLLIADELSDEDFKTLTEEMVQQGMTFERLSALNYVTGLFDDEELRVITRKLGTHNHRRRALYDSSVSWLTNNGYLSIDNLATGLMLGRYSVVVKQDYRGSVGANSPVDFVRLEKGQKPPELGKFTCTLGGNVVVYDKLVIAQVSAIGQISHELAQIVIGCESFVRGDDLKEVYDLVVANRTEGGEVVFKLEDLPEPIKQYVVGKVSAFLADRSELPARARAVYRRNNFENDYPNGFYGLGTAGGIDAVNSRNRQNSCIQYKGSGLYPQGATGAHLRRLESWKSHTALVTGIDMHACFTRMHEHWITHRSVETPLNEGDLPTRYLGSNTTFIDAEIQAISGFPRNVLGNGATLLNRCTRVLLVEEFKGYRVALLEGLTRNSGTCTPMLVVVNGEQPLWGQLDVGNVILESGLTIEPGIKWDSGAWTLLKATYYSQFGSGRITADWYRRTIVPDLRRQRITVTPAQQAVLKRERLTTKFRDLANGKRETMTSRDIVFTRTGLSFQDVKLTLDAAVLTPWLESLNPASIEGVEFNDVMTSCFQTILGLMGDGTPAIAGAKGREYGLKSKFYNGVEGDDDITIVINDLSAVVKYSETARGHARVTIQGKRVNKAEIVPVLMRMMCFRDQETFDAFVGNISKCSLRIMNHVTNGVQFSVNLGFGHNASTGLVSLRRVKGKNYVVLPAKKTDKNPKGEDLIRVRNINKLISLSVGDGNARRVDHYRFGYYGTNVRDVQNVLTTAVPDINPAQVRLLLQTSIKMWLKAFERSKELLENTMKRFKVTEVENPKGLNGTYYKVPASSGNTYYIKKDGENHVHDGAGQHICIVDKGAAMANTVGRDRLVARIYAVALDTQTVQDIHTLRRHVKN